MFILTRRFVCVYSSIINIIFLFFRKFFIHFNNLFDIFFFFILWRSWECDMLLKISLTFKFKNDIIFFFCSFYIVWIFFVISCKIVFIDRCLRIFIWMFKNVFNVLMMYRKRSDIIDFSILFNMFNNIINLYDNDFV